MDTELVCNFRKCRKPIKNEAWVTSCSHIFCAEDGDREIPKSLICPACGTKLNGKYDAVKMDTNPNEQYKAIILAGLNPDTIMEIASRAMSFWAYQVHQELIYKANLASKSTEQRCKFEELYKQDVGKWQTEFNNMNKELECTKVEVVNQKQRSAELSERLMEKSRQLQKVQTMYESLRRKCISPLNSYDRNVRPAVDEAQPMRSFELPPKTPDLYKSRGNVSSFAYPPATLNRSSSYFLLDRNESMAHLPTTGHGDVELCYDDLRATTHRTNSLAGIF